MITPSRGELQGVPRARRVICASCEATLLSLNGSSGDGWGAERPPPSRKMRPCGVGNAVRHSIFVGHAYFGQSRRLPRNEDMVGFRSRGAPYQDQGPKRHLSGSGNTDCAVPARPYLARLLPHKRRRLVFEQGAIIRAGMLICAPGSRMTQHASTTLSCFDGPMVSSARDAGRLAIGGWATDGSGASHANAGSR